MKKSYHEEEPPGNTLAVLRGTRVKHEMKTREILLGRPTKDCGVDVNLLEESLTQNNKISRRQACIKLKRDGQFYIKNLGKPVVFANGRGIPTGSKKKLRDQSIIEICDLQFIIEFKPLYYKIRNQMQS